MVAARARAPKTVDEYLSGVPSRLRPALERLRRTIRAAAPDAEEVLSYRIPAYRQNGMLVYFGAFQDHLSFFVGSARTRWRFRKELRPFATGKGTARFTPERPLPTDLVRRIVAARLAENSARRSGSSRGLRAVSEPRGRPGSRGPARRPRPRGTRRA